MPPPALSSQLPLKILVNGHDELAHREICRTLSSDGRFEITGQNGVLRDLPEVCQQMAVDVAVVAVPRCQDERCCDSVLDVVARTAMLSSSAPVIAVVEKDMTEAAGVLVLAGASGVLARSPSADEFFTATCAVLAGGCAIDAFLMRELFARLAKTAPMDVFEPRQSDAESLTASLPAPDELAMWHQLTDRESDVLRGIARGLSDKNIAASLGIGAGTMKMYVRSIFLKLGVDNRAAAPLVASGMLDLAARLEQHDRGQSDRCLCHV